MAYLFQVLIVICNFHCTKSAIASMIAGMMASHLEFDHQCPSERKGQKRLSRMLKVQSIFASSEIVSWPLYSYVFKMSRKRYSLSFFTWVYLSHKFSLDAVAVAVAAPSLLLWLLRKCSFCATRMTHCACLPSTTIRLLLPCIRSLDKFRRDFAPP